MCSHRAVLTLLTDPVHGPALGLLHQRLRTWNAVSDVLGLTAPRARTRDFTPLSRFMASDRELQRRERAEAGAELARREGDAGLAQADRLARQTLVRRLGTLTAALHFMTQPRHDPTHDWQDDFVLAAAHHSVHERGFCLWRLGQAALAAALGMPGGQCVSAVLLPNGAWRKSQQRRIDGLLARQAEGDLARPERVAQLRVRLAALVARRPVEAAPATDVKVSPDILLEPQRLDPAVVARRDIGGDWLDGLDIAAARVSDASWRHFEQNELSPARLPRAQWPALRHRIDRAAQDWLQNPAASQARTAQAFESCTTLDDGQERGLGVVSRAPLPCFEPLFFYGGTVCVGAESADAYRTLHPQAWRYALEVGLPPADAGATGESDPPDATCFGYPFGNLATRINARRLLGSDLQRQRAANVTMLSVRVPGLPFGLPLLLTRQPVAADEELFLDYGRDFGRFVQQSLAALPRWPTVKLEPRDPEAATLAHFLADFCALPVLADDLEQVDAAVSAAAPETKQALVLPAGWDLRPQPAGGDSALHALEGRQLDAGLLQQLRHDLADVIARWPDSPETSRHNGREIARQMARALAGRSDGETAPGTVRPVPHALRAALVRVAGQPGGLTEVRAWCQLEDDRQRARAAGRGRLRPTRVAVLTSAGALWMVGASGHRAVTLADSDAAACATRLAQALRDADVALLQDGTQFSEVVWDGAAGAADTPAAGPAR